MSACRRKREWFRTHPGFWSVNCEERGRWTYDGYFPAEMGLNIALFVGIWAFLFDQGEELFDTHLGGILLSGAVYVRVG